MGKGNSIMVYMGSKNKYAGSIVPVLQNIIDKNDLSTYVEPFVGGANIIDKIKCDIKYGFDKSIPLIALHNQGQYAPQDIPAHGDSEWWYKAKDIYRGCEGKLTGEEDMEAWRIGAIAFFASFSNGGFSRGYAKNTKTRDYYNEAYKNFINQVEQPLYKDIVFSVSDYKDCMNGIPRPALIYCDPPYEHTKPYGYKFETKFDYAEYWNWVREQSKTNFVICSEQQFPDDFDVIWVKEVKRTCGKTNDYDALEKLGVWHNGIYNLTNK